MAITDNQPINVGNVKALFGALAELTMGGGSSIHSRMYMAAK